jgi:ABC-type transporter Mla subunit MlaD
VVVTAAIGLAVFFTLQKFSFEPRTHYFIRFSLSGGVGGLAEGSEVRVGGLKRGKVIAIIPRLRSDDALDHLDVEVAIDASINLYSNARVYRIASVLGNSSWLNFTSVGGLDAEGDPASPAAKPLTAGAILVAVEAPGLLATLVGSHSADQIVTIIDRASTFSELLDALPADYRAKIVPALDAASTTVVKLRDDYDRWRLKVDDALGSAASAAKNLEDGTHSAVALVAEARETLAENRPHLANTLINLESASESAKAAIDDVRSTTLPQVARILNEGERALGDLASLIDRVDGEIATRLPDIRMFLADLRDAAQQLKLATIEVRRSPWRLLYRPSTDVLAHEQLFEATRTFAAATSNLRSAAESIDELLKQRPDIAAKDAAMRDRLQKSLLDAIERYEEAQRRLFGVLTQEP